MEPGAGGLGVRPRRHVPADRPGRRPHATSAVVPGAGHFLLHEAPDRVLAEINAFYPNPTP
jgi:pimeloyl-ACP methyl ester carboxylesterase